MQKPISHLLLLSAYFMISSHHIIAQVSVSVTINSGSSTTTCTDPFDAPDPGWSVNVDNTGWVQYAGTGSCPFPVLPYQQYTKSYDWEGLLPATVQVCFEAYEHDPNIIIVVCTNRQCIAQTCLDLPVPPLGQSADHTIVLPGGLPSGGSAQLTIATSGSPLGPGIGVCNYTQVYGTVDTDINRGYKMLQIPDGNLLIAGQWNNQAYLMKVDAQGNTLAFQTYGADIGGVSALSDVELAPGGGFVATGECTNCMAGDSTLKVVLIKTDEELHLDNATGVKKFGIAQGGPFATDGQRYSPALASAPDGYMLVSTAGVGGALNAEDLVLTKLSFTLDSLWSKFHTLSFFERATDITFTGDGYSMPINRAFLTEHFLLKTDLNGEALWTRTVTANAIETIEYLSGPNHLVVAGSRATPTQQADVLVYRLDATDGQALDSLVFGESLNDSGLDLHLLDDGNLLLAAQLAQPNAFGQYLSSRVYRIQTDPLQIIDHDLIPNPDDITNMGVTSAVPLSCNGVYFAASGIRGLSNRTFFHSADACGNSITSTTPAFCEGDTATLTALAEGAEYLWSTGETTHSISVSEGGDYSVTITFGCLVQTGTIALEEYPLAQTTVDATICFGETYPLPDGQMATTTGNYQTVLSAASGCDSIITTQLTVLDEISTDVDLMLCQGEVIFLPNGEIVDLPGIFPVIYDSASGCDSTVNYIVEMVEPVVVTDTIITGDDGSGNGSIEVTLTGNPGDHQYLWSNGANTLFINNLIAGEYSLSVTTAGGCSHTFTFEVPLVIAVGEAALSGYIRVFPNPVGQQFTLEITGLPSGEPVEFQLYDVAGRILERLVLGNGRTVMEPADLPAGIYSLRCLTNGKTVWAEKLIKY